MAEPPAVIGPGEHGLVSRRRFLLAALMALSCRTAPAGSERRALGEIEASIGGRLGVFAVDTGSGRVLAHRPDERFAMCSTFKWVLAAAILARVDRKQVALCDRIRYGRADLLAVSPVTQAGLTKGALTIGELAAAAVTVSDNTAANLLLAKLGGPVALTGFVRASGDSVTRLDRYEPALNSNEIGDPRDTTSPRAMASLMRSMLCGPMLERHSRELLVGWLRHCQTGKDRLRGGMPEEWLVGDKTGSGRNGAVNDVAIAIPPGRAPILVAAYLSHGHADAVALAEAHRNIGRLVAHELG